MNLLQRSTHINCRQISQLYFPKPSSVSFTFSHPFSLSHRSCNESLPPSPPSPTISDPGNAVFIKKKYSDTLLLPKTEFPMKIPHEKRNEHEINIANKCQFDQLYGFQSLWRQGQKEFILHDGPPYANGDVHIGHAVNKILKDITNRYKLLRGFQINYMPGWDCHGLPIELKSSKLGKRGVLTDHLQIREAARKIVDQSIASHKEAFKRWGILAEWTSPYKTLDKTYMKTQLQMFLELYEKGLVFRDFKPVFWSPSSKTALAEAELEYRQNHESPSVFLGLDLIVDNAEFLLKIGHENLSIDKDAKIQAVIWTTTPWTLPSNKAIAFHKSEQYSLLDAREGHKNVYYIVASALRNQFFAERNRSYNTVLEFSGEHLGQFKYTHPWFISESCPFVHSDHVTMEKGTGLVHTAPAHGHDDFVIGLKHNLSMDCYVDDNGLFDSTIEELKGLDALSLGNKSIMKKLEKNIVYSSKIMHSYPYDWRTKQPVIIKASKQWFINTERLKTPALEHLKNVRIEPKNIENGMLSQLIRRPYWCISRQRVWGVPIPVLYNKETGEPLINKQLIDKLCELIDTSGNVDYWWTCPISDIITNEEESQKYEKGKDIFDIWFDSGISWHVLGGKTADMYLEGKDQFQGWFQSSLLLSTALKDASPYKSLFVHGFVVDDDGRKMSKSLGNVVNPANVVSGNAAKKYPAYGADVLRWWVATQGSADGDNISVSTSLLRSSDESVQKLRNVIKFLISYCNESSAADLDLEHITYDELMYTDQYMLKLLRDFRQQVTTYYDDYNYHRVLMRTVHFATTDVSAQYFTWAKDRLYCDFKQSQSRKSCIYVLGQIYSTLSKILAPVLPYLIEESYLHYKLGNQSFFKSTWFEDEPWGNSQVTSTFELALDVRDTLNHLIGSNNPKDLWVELQCDASNYKTLQILHPVLDEEMDKCDSELCDILQVSGVDLKCYEDEESLKTGISPKTDPLQPIDFRIKPSGVGHSVSGFSVGICKTEMMQCARCRRFCCTPGDVLCARCHSVMKGLLQKQSQEVQSKIQVESVKKKVTI